MTQRPTHLILAIAVSATACPCLAQTEPPADETEAVAPPVQSPVQPPPPPPGEDVMKPTSHGVRLTPGIARGMARAWVHGYFENEKGFMLSDDQTARLADIASRRLMRIGHRYDKQGADFLQYFAETMIKDDEKVSPERTSVFAERARAASPAARELFGSVPEEFRDILSPEQLEQLKHDATRFNRMLDHFEDRMVRWADGKRDEGEEPFDGLEELISDDERSPGQSPEMQQARNWATWNLRELGPGQWSLFLRQMKHLLGFTDDQYARATKLLRDYREKADAIMTDDWKRRARQNRIRYNFRWSFNDKPIGPWLYHLDREFEEMARPIRELDRSFRREVIALATEQQLDRILAELRGFADEHGLERDEMITDISDLFAVEKEQ